MPLSEAPGSITLLLESGSWKPAQKNRAGKIVDLHVRLTHQAMVAIQQSFIMKSTMPKVGNNTANARTDQ
jgi:hypothetical protein